MKTNTRIKIGAPARLVEAIGLRGGLRSFIAVGALAWAFAGPAFAEAAAPKTPAIPAVPAASAAPAATEGHGHAHEKKAAGPNGGRVITEVEPHAEFLITPERKVRVTFLGDDLKPVAAASQVVTVTTGDRAAPVGLAFKREGDVLVSTTALPAGERLPAIVQIRADAKAKPVIVRFTLNLANCGECDFAEYACVCGH